MNPLIFIVFLALITFAQVSYAGNDSDDAFIVSADGLVVTVSPFQTGSFSFHGGEIEINANGNWFVGVDLYRNALIALPRLGHRGWVPIARVVAEGSSISIIEKIPPALPASRIPKTLRKIQNGQSVNVVVMGSSLATGSSIDRWSGMLFNSAASFNDYKIPGIGTFKNVAVGGTSNQYMLAQLGYRWPSGRTSLFHDVDLVILTCLANGGDYRLSVIESIVRHLKKRGVEIILLTDNPQGPKSKYEDMQNAPLYIDGSEVMRVADLYGVELADTAAYVFEQYIRYQTEIYTDAIHMKAGIPAGVNAARPSGGHEIYARSIRSIIPFSYKSGGTVASSSDFNDGVQGFTPYRAASLSSVNGRLKITKTIDDEEVWGALVDIPALKAGEVVRVQGAWAFENEFTGNRIQVGLIGGGLGWGSTVQAPSPGEFDLMVTANRDIISSGKLLFFANNYSAPINAAVSIDNVIVTMNPNGSIINLIPNRSEEEIRLLPLRDSSDSKLPTDAVITLPEDEIYSNNNHPASGTLGPNPLGENSFARCFSSSVKTDNDMLTLTAGQKAVINGISAVGFSMIRYARTTDAATVIEVRQNDSIVRTLNLGAGNNREEYISIFTPTEYAQLPLTSSIPIELTVTSGILKICALVTLTSDSAIPVTYWAADQGIYGTDALPNAIPFADGVSNLLKYAFNIPLDGPRTSQLNPAAGIGASGLPIFNIVSADSKKIFRLQFLRRRSSDINYVPQCSINMVDFIPMLAPPLITPIDAEWEMLTVDEIFEKSAPTAFFGRVKVSLP